MVLAALGLSSTILSRNCEPRALSAQWLRARCTKHRFIFQRLSDGPSTDSWVLMSQNPSTLIMLLLGSQHPICQMTF